MLTTYKKLLIHTSNAYRYPMLTNAMIAKNHSTRQSGRAISRCKAKVQKTMFSRKNKNMHSLKLETA